ncbi:MAG: TRAP transporter large permease [Mesorhizobium sp.]|nr:TRAP transporter large permease [Mesorhizobium sp.]
MDPIALVGLGLLAMFTLILLHVPIGIAMAISGTAGFAMMVGVQPALSLLASEPVGTLASLDLIVIPLFLLMGSFASASGLSADIYKAAYAFLGHRPGGLSLATIAGCAGFGAVSGSSLATTATMAKVALPEMLSRNYSPSFATGSIAAGGTLGMLIPPSVIMVIYAFLTEQFVLSMFVAAVIPSILAIIFNVLAIILYVKINPAAGPAGERSDWRERMRALQGGWGAIVLLGGVIGGIYGGIFTVNEAAAFGATFAFVFTLMRGRLTKAVMKEALRDTAVNTAMIYLILFGATIFGYFVSATRMPDAVVSVLTEWGLSPYIVIMGLVLMYLILGSVFDTISALLITIPFTFPLVMHLGFDPIWWGIVLILTVEIGLITPPIGMNVLIINSMTPDISLSQIYKGIVIFLWADLLRLALILAFPAIVLWLPRYMGMP